MTLEQAFPWFVAFCMAGGGLLAHHNDASWVAGVAAGLGVGMFPLFLLVAIYSLMLAWCPFRPPCVCGKCNSEDFDFVGPMHKAEDSMYYYECPHCSREYRSHGSKFELKSEHGYSPYMEKSKWHRWKRTTHQSL